MSRSAAPAAAFRRSSASAIAENADAGGAKAAAQAKKRVALGNLTNLAGGRAAAANAKLNSDASAATARKGSFTSFGNAISKRDSHAKQASAQCAPAISRHNGALQKENVPQPAVPTIVPTIAPAVAPRGSFVLPSQSGDSVSMEDTMSTCDSMRSADFDGGDSSLITSLQHWANDDDRDVAGSKLKEDGPAPVEIDHIYDIDNNYEYPQLCATLVYDIYKHLHEAETKNRPSTDFMETTQKDINTSMRAILIDWLVEVAEEFRLVPDTLYLTVNYIDRYLSGNEINWHSLQLLGVACMLIAAKYEEICPAQIEEFCYITDNRYVKDEVLQMEASVLNYLKFEMTAPTAKCFLRRFVRAAQVCDEGPTLLLEFLANYIAELSLLEYSLLCYFPSLVAAASVFLARFIVQPAKAPWNSILSHYTQYKPSDLCDCVKVLHRLFCVGPGSNLPSTREKYSQHKYKFVAKKYCPSSIPTEFFQDATS